MTERALLITTFFDSDRRQRALFQEGSESERAKEFKELAESCRLDIAGMLRVHREAPSASLLIGKGKASQIAERVGRDTIDVVVFDRDLSGSQQRNLEEIVQCKTIDRTQLILDIFARRARSHEGKLQVELAQLNYLLPRLTGQGITLSRLGGGVGTRGPGEQKLEVDRRRIRAHISKLNQRLAELMKRRQASRVRRRESSLPIIAIIGYTNAGKSTLFNRLTASDVFVKDQLFSTLDPTIRRAHFSSDKKTVLLIDTVGFIQDLPHHLIEAFKATLEEVEEADLLIHVMDSTHAALDQINHSVQKVLKELHADQKPQVTVLNKIDLIKDSDQRLAPLLHRWPQALPVCALKGLGIDTLTLAIERELENLNI